MKKVNIGIIGLGIIGERLIKVMQQHEKTNIVGVFDKDINKMKTLSQALDLKMFDSAQTLINSESIDAIYLAVPPKYHKDLAFEIMKAGKHLLCEKPLAGSVEAAKEMADFEKDYSKVTAMNFPLPYTPAYEKLKEILNNKTMGHILKIEVTGLFPDWPRKWQVNPWINTKEEGGFVREVFTHLIQLIVESFGEIQDLISRPEYPKDETLSETAVVGWGRLSSGVPVVFNGLSGVNQKEHLSLTIYGDLATVELINWRQLFLTTLEGGRKSIALEETNPSFDLIDAFYNQIQNNTGDIVSFETGYKVVKIVERLLKTSESC